jgi:hypothetical protein
MKYGCFWLDSDEYVRFMPYFDDYAYEYPFLAVFAFVFWLYVHLYAFLRCISLRRVPFSKTGICSENGYSGAVFLFCTVGCCTEEGCVARQFLHR